MKHSDEIARLAAALVAAQGDFDAIPKTEANPFFKSKYAALPQVVAAAQPILTRHGLAVVQSLGYDDEGDTLTTVLVHTSGEYIYDAARLHLDKDNSQGQGSAVTYTRRYGYMAILGLVADEDDDGNAASSRPSAARSRPTKPAKAESKAITADTRAALAPLMKGSAKEAVELALVAVGAQGVSGVGALSEKQGKEMVNMLSKGE